MGGPGSGRTITFHDEKHTKLREATRMVRLQKKHPSLNFKVKQLGKKEKTSS